MIPVAANHPPYSVHGDVLPGHVANVLPARDLLQNQETDLIARIEKVAGLRVVRGTHDIAMEILAQNERIAALHAGGHGLADPWECLMAV